MVEGLQPGHNDHEETGAPRDEVQAYLNAIGKHDLLSAEEEVELAQRIEAGLYAGAKLAADDRRREEETPILLSDTRRKELATLQREGRLAQTEMVEKNLRLVVSIAKRYKGRGLPFRDLIQEGNLGLIRAVEKFDYRKGFKFSTYATWWIRRDISKALLTQVPNLRLSVEDMEKASRLDRLRRDLFQALGREATARELAQEMNMEFEELVALQRDFENSNAISLNTQVGQEDVEEYGTLIEDEDSSVEAHIEAIVLREQLGLLIEKYTESEEDRRVVATYFGLEGDLEDRSFSAVGKRFGMSRDRVRLRVNKVTALMHAKEAHLNIYWKESA